MKIILSIFILILAGNAVFAQTTGAGEITEIRLENGGGFGVDKGFEITLGKDGAATFRGGKNFYGRKGDYRGAVSDKQFANLAKSLITNNFFALEDRYEGSVNDVGTRTISVVYQGKQKSVVNWGASELKEFSAIETAIRAVEAEIRWQTIEEAAIYQDDQCKVSNPTGTFSNVRSKPNGGKIVRRLKNGTKVFVVYEMGDAQDRPWSKISLSNKGSAPIIGWVLREYLECP